MQQEQDRYNKAIADQKKQYESKLKTDQQVQQMRQKMIDVRKYVEEANEIAKFMNKNIKFT